MNKTKKLLTFFIIIIISALHLNAQINEGEIITSHTDPLNNSSPLRKPLGLTYDGTYYWATCESTSSPGTAIIYKMDNNFNLISRASNFPLYISLAYNKDENYLIACTTNKVVKLNGTTPSTLTEDANNYFIDNNIEAISYGGNNVLWFAKSGNLYKLKLNESFSAHSIQLYSSGVYISAYKITGVAFDGYFVWLLDENKNLYKKDFNDTKSVWAPYYLSGVYSPGDITFKSNLIVMGTNTTSQGTLFEINTAPRPVLNLNVSNPDTGNTLNISWQKPFDNDISEYIIKWNSVSNWPLSYSNTVSAGTYSYTITGLENFTKYFIVVIPKDTLWARYSDQIMIEYFSKSCIPTKPPTIYTVSQSAGPYTTINSALALAEDGDIIEISDNSLYNESLILTNKFLTIKAKEGFHPIIGYGGANPVIVIKTNNITIKNLEIRVEGAPANVPVINIEGKNAIIKNCIIDSSSYSGYDYTGIKINNACNVTITNCIIRDNLQKGIVITNNSEAKIINNEIYNCDKFGIYTKNSSYIEILQNKIYNINGGTGIYVHTYNDAHIFYNIIYNCKNGIYSSANNNNIFNNTVAKNDRGIIATMDSSYYINIYNNISYFNLSNDIFISNNYGTVEIQNNCYKNYSDYNMNYSAIFYYNINDNPLFVDLDNNNFELTASSPCIDAGMNINYSYYIGREIVPINGGARDIGAYEFNSVENENQIMFEESDSVSVILSANNLHPGDTLNLYIGNLDKVSSQDNKIFVTVEIYDITGKKIKTIYNTITDITSPISLNWDGKDENNQYVKSGLYLIIIKGANFQKVKKIFWIR